MSDHSKQIKELERLIQDIEKGLKEQGVNVNAPISYSNIRSSENNPEKASILRLRIELARLKKELADIKRGVVELGNPEVENRAPKKSGVENRGAKKSEVENRGPKKSEVENHTPKKSKNNGGSTFKPNWIYRERYDDYVPECPECKNRGGSNFHMFTHNLTCSFKGRLPDIREMPRRGGSRRLSRRHT
jgi:hypothetical protein